jgi:hypothetical protein
VLLRAKDAEIRAAKDAAASAAAEGEVAALKAQLQAAAEERDRVRQ